MVHPFLSSSFFRLIVFVSARFFLPIHQYRRSAYPPPLVQSSTTLFVLIALLSIVLQLPDCDHPCEEKFLNKRRECVAVAVRLVLVPPLEVSSPAPVPAKLARKYAKGTL